MEDCIFCKIIKGEIPSYKVYEDRNFYGFLDINPLNPGHTLIIPKKHYQWVYNVPNFGEYWEAAKKIALAQIKGLGASSVNFVTLGYAVAHSHIHVISRFDNDDHGGFLKWENIKKISKEEMEIIADKIRKNIK